MTRGNAVILEPARPERHAAVIKTYLIEAHGTVDPEEDQAGFVPRLAAIVARSTLRTRFPCEVHAANDPALATIHGRYRNRERVSLYVDRADPRYWILHTAASSHAADWIVGQLVGSGTDLDRAYIPSQLLGKLTSRGACHGLSLDFDHRIFRYDGQDGGGTPSDFLKMQLWGDRAWRVLELMRQDSSFPGSTTLSRVQVKCWPDERDKNAYCLADVRFDGRITARGTSFEGHATLVDALKKSYSREVAKLESGYRIRARAGGEELTGRALGISTSRPIRDLEEFSRIVFSATKPFLLWGVPAVSSSSFVRVCAVDLRLGSRLDFEITSEFIRVYIPSGSCATAVLRFYTNLQHHHDARVQLLDKDDRDVFES